MPPTFGIDLVREAAASREAPTVASHGPLPTALQHEMEGAFGVDLSAVRIHEGRRSRDLGALAFTQGTDIHFAPGQYQPETRRGQSLLAHELAHVVQQTQGRLSGGAAGVVHGDPRLEEEADDMASRAMDGGSAGARTSAAWSPPAGLPSSGRNAPTVAIQCKAGDLPDDVLKTFEDSLLESGLTLLEKCAEYNKIEASDENYGDHEKLLQTIRAAARRAEAETEAALNEQLSMAEASSDTAESEKLQTTLEQVSSGFLAFNVAVLKEYKAVEAQADGALPESAELTGDAAGILATGLWGDWSSGKAGQSSGVAGGLGKTGASAATISGGVTEVGADMIGLWKLGLMARKWKDMDAGERTRLVYSAVETTADIATSITSADSKKGTGKAAEETLIITQGLSSLRNLVDGVLGAYRTYKSASTSKKDAAVSGLRATRQLTDAVNAAMQMAKNILKLLKTATGGMAGIVPALGLVVEVLHVLEEITKMLIAGRHMETAADRLASEGFGDIRTESKATERTKSATGPVDLQVRGGGLAKKAYRRVSPYVMAHIDKYVLAERGDELKVKLDDTRVKKLSRRTVDKIRSGEFYSKMYEINLKRKVASGAELVKHLTNLAGEITTMSGVGVFAGVTAHATTAAVGLGYKMYSMRRIKREDTKRDVLESKIGSRDITRFESLKAYNEAMGGDTDKSTTQKKAEYIRHAIFLFETLGDEMDDLVGEEKHVIEAKLSEMREMFSLTGVNISELTEVAATGSIKDSIKLLVDAMGSGR